MGGDVSYSEELVRRLEQFGFEGSIHRRSPHQGLLPSRLQMLLGNDVMFRLQELTAMKSSLPSSFLSVANAGSSAHPNRSRALGEEIWRALPSGQSALPMDKSLVRMRVPAAHEYPQRHPQSARPFLCLGNKKNGAVPDFVHEVLWGR